MEIKRNQSLKLAITIPVILMLVFAAYLCFRWALADILSVQVRYQLRKAQMVGRPLSTEQWRLTGSWLDKILWLHPNYSSHLEMAELFHQVASEQPLPLLNELGWINEREKALDYVRQAVLARPTWPYFWNELMLNKIGLNQFDSELAGAMERAISLGPWEEPVQYDVAYSGLDHWDRLQPAAHPWVMLALDNILAFQKNPQPLIDELREHSNIGKLCRSVIPSLLSQHKITAPYCAEFSATR